MNIHFEAALRFIDLGNYEKAVDSLETAVKTESDSGNTSLAIEFTCVLGELLANMDNEERAYEEFKKVLGYCTMTNTLPKQYKIAREFIDVYELSKRGKPKNPEASANAQTSSQTTEFLQ